MKLKRNEFNKLSAEEARILIEYIKPEISKSILFDDLQYLDTNVFNNAGETVYHILGAENRAINKTQRVTYCETDDSIEIRLHTISINRIQRFKDFWSEHYSHVSLELNDDQIESFINSRRTIALACDSAADYLVSQGLAEVDE
jgi:hypothetical protein